jgi:hypothetical protein
MDAKSTISDTDIKLFRRLMNQEGLVLGDKDMDEVFSTMRHSGPHIEVLEDSPKQKPKSMAAPEPLPRPEVIEEEPLEFPAEEAEPVEEEVREEREYDSTPRPRGLFANSMKSPPRRPPSPAPTFERAGPAPSPRREQDFADIDGRAENDNATIRHQKQEILFLLRKRYPAEKDSFSMMMPLVELKYELQRREELEAEQTHLQFAKMALLMVMKWLEKLNSKHGHRLELDGWSASMSEDMGKFDHCLRKLYCMYFRKKALHPLIELLLLFVASAFFFHAKSKQQNGANSKEAYWNQVHDIKPPPSGVPFEKPGNQANMLSSLLHLFGSRP